MKIPFQPGDEVRLIHSGEKATVVNILDDDMIEVEVDGICFPVYADQVEYPYFKDFMQQPGKIKKTLPGYALPVEKPRPVKRMETGLWVQFFPVYRTASEEEVQSVKIFLANETTRDYQMIYRLMKRGKCEFELAQEIRSFSTLYLHDVLFEDFNDKPVFYFQISLTDPDASKLKCWEGRISLKPRELFERIEQLQQQQEASFSKKLFQSYPDATALEIVPVPVHLQASRLTESDEKLAAPVYEIDLHMDKLGVDTAGLSAGELLELQLQIFHQYFEKAIARRQSDLKVIHGIGKGVLRERIHAILQQTPEVKSFNNDQNPGVTQVFFEYIY